MNRKPVIDVIPLGPGDPGLLTLHAAEALRNPDRLLLLRTGRHPAAEWLKARSVSFQTLDEYYDRFDDFDLMHEAMARDLWIKAAKAPLSFGVMDPETDGAVKALGKLRPAGALLRVLPGVSPWSACLAALPVSGKDHPSLQLFTAESFLTGSFQPGMPVMITEIDSPLLAGQVALKLEELYDDAQEVFFFPPGDGLSRKAVPIPLYQLASRKEYDHTAAVWLPGVDYLNRNRFTTADLARIVTRLRAPDGCPWDRIQTHDSLRPYMVEEAWEAVNAIEANDPDHLADELGDVLFQVFIHASIGESYDEFTLTDVVSGICRKMIHRHPHVFGDARSDSARAVSDGWEKLKRQETGSKTPGESLDDVSRSLPSLKYAIKIYKKLAQLPALRRDPEEITAEIRSLAGQLLTEGVFSPEVMSRLLRKCTELCYREDQDAEILLHQGVEDLKRRYREAERRIIGDGKNPEDLTVSQLKDYMED